MGRKSKLPKDIKIEICEKYLKGHGSYQSLGKEYGVADVTVKGWILEYQNLGEAIFDDKPRNSQHTLEYKIEIINKCKNNYINDIASTNGLSKSLVRNWISTYNKGELKGYNPSPEYTL